MGATFITRDRWDARRPRRVDQVDRAQRTGFVLHHSTGANLGSTSGAQWVRNIQRYHMDTRGWSDIGYNFLAWRNPHTGDIDVYEGRGWGALGAHVAGHNTANIGFCWLGDYRDRHDDFTVDMVEVTWAWYDLAQRTMRKDLTLYGHQQLGKTACPGHQIMRLVEDGRPKQPVADKTHWTEEAVKKLPTLNKGAKGEDVKTLQGLLHARGSRDSAIDGVFGAKTTTAVRREQTRAKITVDGIVGPQTWPRLLRV